MSNIIKFPRKEINYDIVDRATELAVIEQNLRAAESNAEPDSMLLDILEQINAHIELRIKTANDN